MTDIGASFARFFEYGEVSVQAHDPRGNMASLKVCMPCCLMQTLTPALLGGGLIDRYEVMLPIAAWVPKSPEERFRPDIFCQAPDIVEAAASHTAKNVKKALELFVQLSQILLDPADAVPILPMGTYVTFQYRCRTDALAGVLSHIESIRVVGVPEFRYALATVFAFLLTQEGSTAVLVQ